MSVIPDFNVMDMLFDQMDTKVEDIKVEDNYSWDNTGVDFLDSILFNHNVTDLLPLPEADDFLINPPNSDVVVGSGCSDSGVSSDQQMSPKSFQDGFDDLEALGIINPDTEITYQEPPAYEVQSPIPATGTDFVEIVSDDVEVKEEIEIVDVEGDFVETPVKPSPKPVVRVKPVSPVSKPFNHSSPKPLQRPILMPVKGKKSLKTIKIIKAVGYQAPVSAVRQSPVHQQVQQPLYYEEDHSSSEDTGDEGDSHPPNHVYPRLQLSEEEKRLMIKEGLSLPTRYPLTKQEERDLKRIRRKIRNKISAQDSRKRKKEYVDGLEDRVKKCTAENANLIKKMKALQNENQSLSAQLKRLQAVIARNGPQQTNPTTCLVVLVLSLALVLAPNMRSASRAATPSDLSIPETKASSPIVPGRTRTILESTTVKPLEDGWQDIPIDGASDFEDEEDQKSGILSELAEMLQFRIAPSLRDHDYAGHRVRKRSRSFVVPPVDDKWPPPKRPYVTTTTDRSDSGGGHRTMIRSFAPIIPKNRTGHAPPSPNSIVEIELTSSSDDGF
ncbi:bZIP transcription factor [Nesidiocoris tenuis]|uniref:BZIP transcription factor n=1 Tax=Nesidiocoris tenuis TaxID=355587 RepID=A0ABN7AS75_9HEMI|nr:bZIP transcription factor [Nesidiocoris tenuis]